MKIARIAALAVPAVIALAGCSGNADLPADDAASSAGVEASQAAQETAPADSDTTPAADTTTPAADGTGAAGAAGKDSSASPTAIPGADTAQVKVTKCEAGKNGVDIEVDVKNTSDKPRNYVIAVGVKDSAGKTAGGGAVMVQADAGKSAKGTGEAPAKVKGKVTCEVNNIGSVEG
ncbi:hypothetical protein [Gephyromycinifex aptenodytis]|uniref:hypothetical protein n=1 Tax=Gephyromycinifex aptenodytis TaxID=2716227 RepID=UPI00144660A8|nr:hypothetical protein [Gephyromycinifex aptenodytis]